MGPRAGTAPARRGGRRRRWSSAGTGEEVWGSPSAALYLGSSAGTGHRWATRPLPSRRRAPSAGPRRDAGRRPGGVGEVAGVAWFFSRAGKEPPGTAATLPLALRAARVPARSAAPFFQAAPPASLPAPPPCPPHPTPPLPTPPHHSSPPSTPSFPTLARSNPQTPASAPGPAPTLASGVFFGTSQVTKTKNSTSTE